jgi:hypothetical protein
VSDAPTDDSERHAYQTVALLSALSVAAEWHECKQTADTHLDPTTLVPTDAACEAVQIDARRLASLGYQLRVHTLAGDDGEQSSVGLLRRLDRALVLRRMGRVTIRLHQNLLSVYPLRVDEEQIERARSLEGLRRQLPALEQDDFDRQLSVYAAEALGVAEGILAKLA